MNTLILSMDGVPYECCLLLGGNVVDYLKKEILFQH